MRKAKEYICLLCKNVYYSKDYRSKFCSRSCASSYNLRRRTIKTETKLKISTSLKHHFKINPTKTRGFSHAQAVGKFTTGKYKTPTSILDVSKRTTRKLIARLNLKCCICGWDEASIDLHHIIPKKLGGGDTHDNISPLCPNHHRLAHSGKLSTKLIPLSEILLDSWKQVYFG